MCGIVGAASSTLTPLEIENFRWLLHFDTVRGEDATGIALSGTKTDTDKSGIIVAKTIGRPDSLFTRYPGLFTPSGKINSSLFKNINLIIGHNRSRTLGENTDTNAHPFYHKGVVGCHNGTISNGLLDLPKVGDSDHTLTDSERIIHALASGISLQDIANKLTGSMALCWYDSNTKKLNLFRNKDRPLFYYVNYSTIYWASEAWILESVLSRNSKNFDKKNLFEMEDDEHVTIDLSKYTSKSNIESKTIEKKYFTQVGVKHNYQEGLYKNYYHGAGAKDSVIQLPDYFERKDRNSSALWVNTDYTEEEFNKIAKSGCSYCCSDLDYGDYVLGNVKFLEKDAPLCQGCVTGDINNVRYN